jgi:uncharacterized circularly permuted ATP-grasp superfamily protein
MADFFQDYDDGGFYDEMFASPGVPHPHYERLLERYEAMSGIGELFARQKTADQTFINRGVTFTVYSDEAGTEKIFPFDLIPRIIAAKEWATMEAGLTQRMQALDLFLQDIYSDQRIVNEGIIPRELIESCSHFRPELVGVKLPRHRHVHINGTDLIRDANGEYCVLEDNLRTPSGVSYVLENRQIMKRVFPNLLRNYRVRPVAGYTADLLDLLNWLAPEHVP